MVLQIAKILYIQTSIPTLVLTYVIIVLLFTIIAFAWPRTRVLKHDRFERTHRVISLPLPFRTTADGHHSIVRRMDYHCPCLGAYLPIDQRFQTPGRIAGACYSKIAVYLDACCFDILDHPSLVKPKESTRSI